MASEEDNQHIDAVPINLPAPPGWSKKFTPKKGGTPQRKDIVFISPTGEEIKSKRQLDQYLKSHPGEPAASEFNWSTGDTPRRSSRLSEKSKADVTLSSPSPTKRQKKSNTKGANEKSKADAEEEATSEKDAAAVEAKETVEGSTVDAKDAVDDVISGKPPESEDEETITDAQVASEEPSTAAPVGTETEKLNASVEESNNATPFVGDAKLEESSSGVPSAKVEATSHVVPDAKNEEIKGVTSGGNETADGKVGNSGNVDYWEEKEAEEKDNYPQQ